MIHGGTYEETFKKTCVTYAFGFYLDNSLGMFSEFGDEKPIKVACINT